MYVCFVNTNTICIIINYLQCVMNHKRNIKNIKVTKVKKKNRTTTKIICKNTSSNLKSYKYVYDYVRCYMYRYIIFKLSVEFKPKYYEIKVIGNKL